MILFYPQRRKISVCGSTLPLVSSVTNVEYTEEAAEDDAINR